MSELSDLDREILSRCNRAPEQYHDRTGCYQTKDWASLVRRGLLQSTTQSEQVRGERRAYWQIYKITPAGRTALEDPKP